MQIIYIPLLTAIVEALKQAVGLEKKYIPLVSLLLGIILSTTAGATGNFTADVVMGIAYGLASSGLYSGSKTVVGK